jgi:phosphoserine phosphatase
MRGISVIVFDLDGTLVRYHDVEFESSWGALAVAAGVQEASRALLKEYLPRRDAYAEWVTKDGALLTGIPVRQVTDCLFPAPYAAGVAEAVERLRGTCRLGILSSGVDLVADWVRRDLGLDFVRANHLEVEDGRFTGRSETRVGLWSKGEALQDLAEEEGFSLEEVCYVGDHINDVPAMERAALAIAANPKDERLASVCDHVIEDFASLPGLVAAHRP